MYVYIRGAPARSRSTSSPSSGGRPAGTAPPAPASCALRWPEAPLPFLFLVISLFPLPPKPLNTKNTISNPN